MSVKITGNFYGQDREAAERDAKRLNSQNTGIEYIVSCNMNAGGYQIDMYRERDDENLGYYDDGDQWNMPKDSKWAKL